MTKCKGENCKAIDGVAHSPECIAEHDIAYETPGNRNPEFRYAGYKNRPISANHTPDQLAAWNEGNKARK